MRDFLVVDAFDNLHIVAADQGRVDDSGGLRLFRDGVQVAAFRGWKQWKQVGY